MVVMESVGANRLGLYNPAERTSPQLLALARHAIVFQRIYGAEAETSAAMPGLICSVYPAHSPFSIPREMPAIAIPGLPAILADHGYRTAFIHNGQLAHDRQKDFLRDHGFAEIFDAPRDYPYPRDSEVVPAAVNWLKSNLRQPFFLTIWTQDTHHPYLNAVQHGVHEAPPLEHYERAVRSTDSLIGRVADALARLKLADDTLLVITGDHGEAFREHDMLIHGLSVYNLATDPGEQHDLSSDPARSAMMHRAQLRLEAWLAFQNSYLARFGDAPGKPVYVSAPGAAR